MDVFVSLIKHSYSCDLRLKPHIYNFSLETDLCSEHSLYSYLYVYVGSYKETYGDHGVKPPVPLSPLALWVNKI